MTLALLKCLSQKKIRKMRKSKMVSIQYIFNRMVEYMPDSDEEDEDEDEEEESEDEDESEEDDEDEDDLDPMTGEEREEGQRINLSWPSSCLDPSKVHFPF
ncbi:unnamed protein product [Polarella glacialis]|uniref:Uncharacterized protein n=1 Tax=Polarella glacialis TaxID=89957 RepID=A0A813KXY1_POLGL|nr:unnamed protein product [Polarella glacialis]